MPSDRDSSHVAYHAVSPFHHNLYQENRNKVDLEKAIILHKEEIELTSPFSPGFANAQPYKRLYTTSFTFQ